MTFGEGVAVMGDYPFCSTVQGRAAVTTALTPQPSFFCSSDENIHTSAYSFRFAVFNFSSLALPLQR